MSRTADETILKLKQILSRFEILQILVSDNGTAFTSKGQVERFRDTFKRALIKKITKEREPHNKYSSVVTEPHQIQTHLMVTHQQKH